MASRRARRIVAVLVGVVVLWCVAAALVLARARTDALAGKAIVDRVRERTTDVRAITDGEARGELADARTRFARARAGTGAWWLSPLRALPVVGRQVRSAHALSRSAEALADAAVDAIAEAHAVLDLPHTDGAHRLALLRRLGALVTRLNVRLEALDLGPPEGLVASLATARRDLETEVFELRRTLGSVGDVVGAAVRLLDGPRRTLLVAANNAEMRAGSGMFLSLAPLRTAGGDLSLGSVRSVTASTPPPGSVRVGGDLEARWGWLSPADEWRNLMLSPRFDAQAPLAARMWREAGRAPVRGVIAIDPLGLRAVLRATGPVRVGGRTIGPDDVEDELLYRQYVRFVERGTASRRDALGGIARAAFAALNRGGWDPLVLADELARAARGRHLMLWSDDAREQAAWDEAGLSGALTQDSMLVGVLNRGGNKLDRFLGVTASLTLSPDDGGTAGTLRVRLDNDVPADAPTYVAGPNPVHGQRRGEYVGVLAVTLPGWSGAGSIQGGSRVVAVGGDGPSRVVAAEFRIPRGRARTLVVRFRFAAGHGSLRVEPSARVPAVAWTFRGAAWRDTGPRVIRW